MEGEAPRTLGLSAETLWDHIAPLHVRLETGVTTTEAVLITEDEESSLVFLPADPLPPDAPRVDLPAQVAGDGAGEGRFVSGGYVTLDAGSYLLVEDEPGDLVFFTPEGLLPSLGEVLLAVPIAALPAGLADQISSLPYDDAEEPEDLFAGYDVVPGPPQLLLGGQ